MISCEDVATIADCAKRKDRKGLVDWVRSKRDAVWIFDANKDVTLSRLTDVNSGARASEWLDFEQPYTVDAFREWLVGMLYEGRASELNPFFQSKAADLLLGNLDIPTKQGRPKTVSTAKNTLLAIACVDEIMRAGIPQKHSVECDNKEYFTAVSIVASGLQVSPSSVRGWLNIRNNFKKSCLENNSI
jgi:hypothetical protein